MCGGQAQRATAKSRPNSTAMDAGTFDNEMKGAGPIGGMSGQRFS
jgi:hypothetical protein